MDIEYLQEFLDLANTLNFTKTSHNLHMTQPTLSRHIAELEKRVGSPLFARTTNSVKLTQNGRLLYEKACALVADYNSAIDAIYEASERQVTTLRVTGSIVQPTVNRLFSKLATRAAAERLPVRFEYSRVRSLSNEPPAPFPLDALKDHEVDLVIDTCSVAGRAPQEFEAMRLCDERLTVIATADNALAQAVGLRAEDLFSNTLVAFAVQQHCPQVLFSPFLAAGYSPGRTKTLFVDNILEIPERLGQLQNDEIVPMQKEYCASFGFDQDGAGRLVALDIADDRIKGSFWAVRRKNDDNPAIAQAIGLLQDIVDDCKSSAPMDEWSDETTLWSSAFYL